MGNTHAGSYRPKKWHKHHSAKVPHVGPASPTIGEAFTINKKLEIDSISEEEDTNAEDGAMYCSEAEQEIEVEPTVYLPKAVPLLDETETEDIGVSPTVFRWTGGGEEVFISGSFTDWKPIPMVKSSEDFVSVVNLPTGEYQYKFFVDGSWKLDPNAECVVLDKRTMTKNNVLNVKTSDFEVFQALEKDEVVKSRGESKYSQEIPLPPTGKVVPPPMLPPHLLNVILNKNTPLTCEPALLPEPEHVMLNHMYATSIKDGVMVLSSTHRFRKKFVTTVLYKPT